MNTFIGLSSRQRHNTLATIPVFFLCIALLFGYLLAMRFYFPLPTAVFWVATIAAILVILFQITQIPWPGYEGFLLTEILILGVALLSVYQIPFSGIYESDSYENMMVTRKTLEYGVLTAARPGTETAVYGWPLTNIYGAELHFLTGMTTFNIAKWSSLIMSSIFTLLMYIIVKKVFKSEKAAFLTILLIVTLQYFTVYRISFKSENIALVIMMAMLFFLTQAEGNNRVKFSGLSILCLAGVVLAHHLTPLMLLILLLACLATSRITGLAGKTPLSKKPTIVATATVALLTFVGVFSYWLYVYDEPLVALARLGQTLLTQELGTGTPAEQLGLLQPEIIPTIRGLITLYGYYFFHAVFAIILLHKIFFQPKDKSPEFYSFAAFLFICGVIVALRMYFLSSQPVNIPPGRLFAWGWMFGFAPLVVGILENKPTWSLKAGIILLAGFMLFNVYTTPENTWNFRQPGRLMDDIVLREDYAVAETLALSSNGAAYHKTRLAIYDVQGYFSKDLREVSSVDRLEALDWIVVKKKEFERYEEMGSYEKYATYEFNPDVVNRLAELLKGSSYQGRNKIYESNNIFVLK